MYATSAEQTKLLLKAGADVNIKDFRCGITPLMTAQTPEQTKLLIESGADVNARSDQGSTALIFAQTPEQRVLLEQALEKAEIKKKIENNKRVTLEAHKLHQQEKEEISSEIISKIEKKTR